MLAGRLIKVATSPDRQIIGGKRRFSSILILIFQFYFILFLRKVTVLQLFSTKVVMIAI